MKKKTMLLTLMVKRPIKKVPKIPYGDWDFKWAAADEIKDLEKQGYVNNKMCIKK